MSQGGDMTPNDRLLLFCRQAPDVFIQNLNLLVFTLNPPANYPMSGMSQEIFDIANDHKQTLADAFAKLSLWKMYATHCATRMTKQGFFMTGSTLNGLALKTSDVDLIILTRTRVKHKHNKRRMEVDLSWIINVLKTCPSVAKAQLKKMGDKPYIYFKDLVNGYDVDVVLNLMNTVMNAHLMRRYVEVDWRVQPLGIILKLFGQIQALFGSFDYSFNSYHLTLMLIHYLQVAQVVPCLHSMPGTKGFFVAKEKIFDIDFFKPMNIVFDSTNHQTLEELLIGFFDYYNKFNYDAKVISIRLGHAYPKNQFLGMILKKHRASYCTEFLKLEEPFESKNASRRITDDKSFNRVKAGFKIAYHKLMETRDIKSILKPFD